MAGPLTRWRSADWICADRNAAGPATQPCINGANLAAGNSNLAGILGSPIFHSWWAATTSTLWRGLSTASWPRCTLAEPDAGRAPGGAS
jgi:hypothetical protein